MSNARVRSYRAAALPGAMAAAFAFMAACGGSEQEAQAPVISTDPIPAASSPSPAISSAAPSAEPSSAPPEVTSAAPKGSPPPPAAKWPADAVTGPTATAPPAASSTSPGAKVSMEGKLTSRAGSVLVVEVVGLSPTAGSKGVLYRRFEQDFGPLRTSGWLAIADVTVKQVKGEKITLDLVAEKSIIMLNGKKVNHFERGNVIKLEIAP